LGPIDERQTAPPNPLTPPSKRLTPIATVAVRWHSNFGSAATRRRRAHPIPEAAFQVPKPAAHADRGDHHALRVNDFGRKASFG
jgi:hypothetical protein